MYSYHNNTLTGNTITKTIFSFYFISISLQNRRFLSLSLVLFHTHTLTHLFFFIIFYSSGNDKVTIWMSVTKILFFSFDFNLYSWHPSGSKDEKSQDSSSYARRRGRDARAQLCQKTRKRDTHVEQYWGISIQIQYRTLYNI